MAIITAHVNPFRGTNFAFIELNKNLPVTSHPADAYSLLWPRQPLDFNTSYTLWHRAALEIELWKGAKSTYLHILTILPSSDPFCSEMGSIFGVKEVLVFFNFQKQYTENSCNWEADLAVCELYCVSTIHIWKPSFCHVCIDMAEFTKSIYMPFVLQCGLYTWFWLTVQKKKKIIVEQKRR